MITALAIFLVLVGAILATWLIYAATIFVRMHREMHFSFRLAARAPATGWQYWRSELKLVPLVLLLSAGLLLNAAVLVAAVCWYGLWGQSLPDIDPHRRHGQRHEE
jgi:hypothetical protein